jgi:hypothetical protein
MTLADSVGLRLKRGFALVVWISVTANHLNPVMAGRYPALITFPANGAGEAFLNRNK